MSDNTPTRAEGEVAESKRLTPEQIEEIRQGRIFLHHFFSLIRTAVYHAANNSALVEPSESFAKVLRWFLARAEGPIKLEVGQEQMFLSLKRVRPSKRQKAAILSLEKFFKRRGIGGLLFLRPMNPQQVRVAATSVAIFSKGLLDTDGVEGITELFKEKELHSFLLPVEPLGEQAKNHDEIVRSLGEQGQHAVHLAKGLAMVKAASVDDSEIARAGARHVVREMSDLDEEARYAVLGMSMVGATMDMGMRSLSVLLVAMAMADALKMPRGLRADLGQACLELVRWDDQLKEGWMAENRGLEGAQALRWLFEQKKWSISTLRQGLTLAGRYMPPQGDTRGKETSLRSSRLAEILRAACDYVDLTMPSPMRGVEPFIRGGPYPPTEALRRMRKQVGVRYSKTVLASVVRGVGLLPLGTPVELADGNGAVVVGRTENPLIFVVQETLSGKEREAGFRPGAGQIVRVITGGDLLKVRSKFLLGEDHGKIEELAQAIIKDNS